MTSATAVSSAEISPGVRAALGGRAPTAEQWAAISAPPGPVHLVAGAGSGKTAVMAARVVWLVESAVHADPVGVLALTFTNRAAEELAARVRAALAGHAPDTGQPTVSTYHAFAADLLRAAGARIGVEPDAGLLTEAQQHQLVEELLDTERLDHLEVRSPSSTAAAVLALAGACADHLVPPAQVAAAATEIVARAEAGGDLPAWLVANTRERAELARLATRYNEAKRRLGRLDFGDQVARAVELVEGHPDLAARLRARHPHVLLDEYQDTNVAQRRLIQQLCPPGSSVTAVGDARQAIYAFRGATLHNLLAFPDHFPGTPDRPGAARTLATNFRCGRRILDLANTVADGIPEERRGGGPLAPPPSAADGTVRAALLPDQATEAGFVADQILAARRDGLPGGRFPAWRDVAVLARSRRLLGPLRTALEQRGIPVEVVGLSGLLDAPEVVELVSVLRVLHDQGDGIALTRLLLGPRWRVAPRHLARLAAWCSKRNWQLREHLPGEDPSPGDVAWSLADALDHADDVPGLDGEARRRLAGLRAELRDLDRHSRGPLPELVDAVLDRTGLRAELDASPDPRAHAARRNLDAFAERVAAFAPLDGQPPTLAAFLHWLDAVETAAEAVDPAQPAETDTVKLMTVHQAKGLEFPMVVVAGLAAGRTRDGSPADGLFPATRPDSPLTPRRLPYELREDAAQLPRYDGRNYRAFKAALVARGLEDERRLFYVAATRARDMLLLTAAWWYQGADRRPKGPGPFWEEAAAHPAVEVLTRAAQPGTSPLAGRLGTGGSWPPPARPSAPDPLLPDGPAAAVHAARHTPAVLDRLRHPGEEDAETAAAAAQAALLTAAGPPPGAPAHTPPRVLSVTDLLEYDRCPRAFHQRLVRPVPEPPRGTAARTGTAVHRVLEQLAPTLTPPHPAAEGSATTEDDIVARDGAGPSTTSTRPDARPAGVVAPVTEGASRPAGPRESRAGAADRAVRNLRASRLGGLPAPLVEVDLTLRSGPWTVRGRADALYETEQDGSRLVEVVDWKTGAHWRETAARAENPDQVDQLALYALALRDLGHLDGDRCQVTYAHLTGDSPELVTRLLDRDVLDHQRAALERVLARIDAADWEGCEAPDCWACTPRR